MRPLNSVLTPIIHILSEHATSPDTAISAKKIKSLMNGNNEDIEIGHISSCLSSHVRSASATNIKRVRAPIAKGHGSKWIYYWSHRAAAPKKEELTPQGRSPGSSAASAPKSSSIVAKFYIAHPNGQDYFLDFNDARELLSQLKALLGE